LIIINYAFFCFSKAFDVFALRRLCIAVKFKAMCRQQALSASGGLLVSKARGLNLMVFAKHRLKAKTEFTP
jgi:hypothetical protein